MSKEECCAGAGAGERVVVVVVVAAAASDERCREVICRSWLACRSCFSIEIEVVVYWWSDKAHRTIKVERYLILYFQNCIISRFVASVLAVHKGYPI